MTKKHMALTGGELLNSSADRWPWITGGDDGNSMPRWDVSFCGSTDQLGVAGHCLDWLFDHWRTRKTKVEKARINETLTVVRSLVHCPKKIKDTRHLRTLRGEVLREQRNERQKSREG